jgi:hypothetical protein
MDWLGAIYVSILGSASKCHRHQCIGGGLGGFENPLTLFWFLTLLWHIKFGAIYRISLYAWWYAWCQSWQLNFIYWLYSFQTRHFCIIVLEFRSSIGTNWLRRGLYCWNHPFILLMSKCQSVILDLVELDLDVEVVEELKLPKVQNKFCT